MNFKLASRVWTLLRVKIFLLFHKAKKKTREGLILLTDLQPVSLFHPLTLCIPYSQPS